MNDTVDQFDGLHGYYFEDLKEGMSDSYAKTVTETDIVNFAGTSGDTNPAHLNKEFAAKTMFKDCIAIIINFKTPGNHLQGCCHISFSCSGF